ncbi:MAG: glutamine synthetase family protein [Methylacidiphilales bacterium]|nr:glutamine synthetase family protein [Candidatus Methylacidiphilales bacterium]
MDIDKQLELEYKEAKKWLEDNPTIDRIEVVICDINGIFRGKSIPISKLDSVYQRKMRMPLSTFYFDVWGNDVTRISYASGDLDGICLPSNLGLMPKVWNSIPSSLLMVTLTNEEGVPSFYDPRNALVSVVQKYQELQLTPVVAFEMEFYLTNPNSEFASPPTPEGHSKPLQFTNSYSMDELEIFDTFMDEVIVAAEGMRLPTENILSECGCGQFEINLVHQSDAVRAADDALLLKQIIRGIARKHGYRATFMAKPYLEQSGSGMHMHYSLIDNQGKNIFDDGTDKGTQELLYALGGMCKVMGEYTLFCAPNINSYRRLRHGELCPKNISWGYDNRTVALRIPSGPPVSRRIEFRLPGADANPYLVAATSLGSALYGLTKKIDPPKPITGNAYMANAPEIPQDWATSIETLEKGTRLKDIIDPKLIKIFLDCKNQEYDVFSTKINQFEYSTYLDML